MSISDIGHIGHIMTTITEFTGTPTAYNEFYKHIYRTNLPTDEIKRAIRNVFTPNMIRHRILDHGKPEYQQIIHSYKPLKSFVDKLGRQDLFSLSTYNRPQDTMNYYSYYYPYNPKTIDINNDINNIVADLMALLSSVIQHNIDTTAYYITLHLTKFQSINRLSTLISQKIRNEWSDEEKNELVEKLKIVDIFNFRPYLMNKYGEWLREHYRWLTKRVIKKFVN